MHIPSFNKFEDRQEIIGFMQRYSFASIVSIVDSLPFATHLPFLVKEENNKVFLYSHFAKANPQAKSITESVSMVIFTEPHAYVSPSNYETEKVVPTWNYIAVHAYGQATLLEDMDRKAELLKHTIETFEVGYFKQWESLPDEYRSRMMNGIVAFEIEVTDLQAKKKLSQNRTEIEKDNIIHSLEKSLDTNEREIAAYMKQLKH